MGTTLVARAVPTAQAFVDIVGAEQPQLQIKVFSQESPSLFLEEFFYAIWFAFVVRAQNSARITNIILFPNIGVANVGLSTRPIDPIAWQHVCPEYGNLHNEEAPHRHDTHQPQIWVEDVLNGEADDESDEHQHHHREKAVRVLGSGCTTGRRGCWNGNGIHPKKSRKQFFRWQSQQGHNFWPKRMISKKFVITFSKIRYSAQKKKGTDSSKKPLTKSRNQRRPEEVTFFTLGWKSSKRKSCFRRDIASGEADYRVFECTEIMAN